VDNKRFDDIAKSIASLASRRSVVKGMVGGAIAGVVGLRESYAAGMRSAGQICRKNEDCASKTCGPKDTTGRRRCTCDVGSPCRGVCCLTYCSEDLVCADSVTDAVCYRSCLESYCYSSNFNYTFNHTGNCEEFCAFDICSIRN